MLSLKLINFIVMYFLDLFVYFFQIKDNIIGQIKHVKINSKELMSKVSTVVAMATNERDEISQESQVYFILFTKCKALLRSDSRFSIVLDWPVVVFVKQPTPACRAFAELPFE